MNFLKMPIAKKKTGPKPKYPFDKISAGRCFVVVPLPGQTIETLRASILTTAKKRGYEVTTTIEGNKVMVWKRGKK